MMLKVCKFGGTSMSSSIAINKVTEIIHSDDSRRYVVVSAPGKRDNTDIKITDTLYQCFREMKSTGSCNESFSLIYDRYMGIVRDLGLKIDMKTYLDNVKKGIESSQSPDFAASRGEYLNALIMAEQLGYAFVDAADVIRFNDDGTFDEDTTNDLVQEALSKVDKAVIPGFYGSYQDGRIKTFSRGGSDITGAIIARGVNADLYENWTDVSGFLKADPRIVNNPERIKTLSFRELRELSYMGASVLHPDAVFPVRVSGIPINIRNTFAPQDEGTMIVPHYVERDEKNIVTGIAGKKNFAIILIEKSMMNSEIGFSRRVLSVFEKYGISIEHMPSGIDTLSVVVSEEELKNKLDNVIMDIRSQFKPNTVEVYHGIALIATVGHGMSRRPGTSARLFKSIYEADVNVRMIDQGSSEMNIIIGVENDDYEKALAAIYHEFIG
ncbi:MAG: aspartate kinase [Clostridia bacterium]|nr:aspartate kinase [Clostridia bacterium]